MYTVYDVTVNTGPQNKTQRGTGVGLLYRYAIPWSNSYIPFVQGPLLYGLCSVVDWCNTVHVQTYGF